MHMQSSYSESCFLHLFTGVIITQLTAYKERLEMIDLLWYLISLATVYS